MGCVGVGVGVGVCGWVCVGVEILVLFGYKSSHT